MGQPDLELFLQRTKPRTTTKSKAADRSVRPTPPLLGDGKVGWTGGCASRRGYCDRAGFGSVWNQGIDGGIVHCFVTGGGDSDEGYVCRSSEASASDGDGGSDRAAGRREGCDVGNHREFRGAAGGSSGGSNGDGLAGFGSRGDGGRQLSIGADFEFCSFCANGYCGGLGEADASDGDG